MQLELEKSQCESNEWKQKFISRIEKEEKIVSADAELREDVSKIMDALRESKTDLRFFY